jgi:hypothetical protein
MQADRRRLLLASGWRRSRQKQHRDHRDRRARCLGRDLQNRALQGDDGHDDDVGQN